MRPPRLRLLATMLLSASLVGAVGCSSKSPRTTASSTTTGPAPTASTPPATTVASTTAITVALSPSRCATTDLQVSLEPGGAAAGSIFHRIVFENMSTRTCTLTGYPGVSLLAATGAQIGTPATRAPGAPRPTVTLAPGAVASAVIHTINSGVAPDCGPTSAKVRVYVPNERTAVDLDAQIANCHHLFEVKPVVAGAEG